MKKMPKSCGLDSVMMLQMSQISEKNIHFAHVFIRVFQILHIKDRRIGTVFFSKYCWEISGTVRYCWEISGTTKGYCWEISGTTDFCWKKVLLHGVFLDKCCLSLEGYWNSFPQY